MTYNRHIIPTGHIHNLRDYGGYRVHGGGRLRTATLFRSGEHSGATAPDLAVVDDLALKTVIDLRSGEERLARPHRQGPASQAKILFSDSYIHARPPHVVAMDVSATPEMVRRHLVEYYRSSPFKAEQIQCLRLYFASLIGTDGPTLVHCAAGKDRTGIAVALFHAVAGVAEDDIFADYLLTNDASDLSDRIAAFGYSVRRHLGDDLNEETLRISLSVEPEYLAAMFQALENLCDGVAGYFRTILQFETADVDRLANKFLV